MKEMMKKTASVFLLAAMLVAAVVCALVFVPTAPIAVTAAVSNTAPLVYVESDGTETTYYGSSTTDVNIESSSIRLGTGNWAGMMQNQTVAGVHGVAERFAAEIKQTYKLSNDNIDTLYGSYSWNHWNWANTVKTGFSFASGVKDTGGKDVTSVSFVYGAGFNSGVGGYNTLTTGCIVQLDFANKKVIIKNAENDITSGDITYKQKIYEFSADINYDTEYFIELSSVYLSDTSGVNATDTDNNGFGVICKITPYGVTDEIIFDNYGVFPASDKDGNVYALRHYVNEKFVIKTTGEIEAADKTVCSLFGTTTVYYGDTTGYRYDADVDTAPERDLIGLAKYKDPTFGDTLQVTASASGSGNLTPALTAEKDALIKFRFKASENKKFAIGLNGGGGLWDAAYLLLDFANGKVGYGLRNYDVSGTRDIDSYALEANKEYTVSYMFTKVYNDEDKTKQITATKLYYKISDGNSEVERNVTYIGTAVNFDAANFKVFVLNGATPVYTELGVTLSTTLTARSELADLETANIESAFGSKLDSVGDDENRHYDFRNSTATYAYWPAGNETGFEYNKKLRFGFINKSESVVPSIRFGGGSTAGGASNEYYFSYTVNLDYGSNDIVLKNRNDTAGGYMTTNTFALIGGKTLEIGKRYIIEVAAVRIDDSNGDYAGDRVYCTVYDGETVIGEANCDYLYERQTQVRNNSFWIGGNGIDADITSAETYFNVSLDGANQKVYDESYNLLQSEVTGKTFVGYKTEDNKLYNAGYAVSQDFTATTLAIDFKMVKGAAIRTAQPMAIRFTAKIDSADYGVLSAMGIEIAMSVTCNEAEITENRNDYDGTDGAHKTVCGVVANISDFDAVYTAKAFIKVRYESETEDAVIYAEANGGDNSRSLKQVAAAALADDNYEKSAEIRAVLESITASAA